MISYFCFQACVYVSVGYLNLWLCFCIGFAYVGIGLFDGFSICFAYVLLLACCFS